MVAYSVETALFVSLYIHGYRDFGTNRNLNWTLSGFAHTKRRCVKVERNCFEEMEKNIQASTNDNLMDRKFHGKVHRRRPCHVSIAKTWCL